jgi:hypothetical protein
MFLITARIIKTINEEDIYEPIIDIGNENNEGDKAAVDVVRIYSNNNNVKEKRNDVIQVNKNSLKKMTTMRYFKKNTIIEQSNDPFE